MPIMVLVEVRAKAETVDRFKGELPALFPDTRAYDGCQGITAYACADDGHTLVFVEDWETKTHYERYLAWRKETGVFARLTSMLADAPSIRFFQKVDA